VRRIAPPHLLLLIVLCVALFAGAGAPSAGAVPARLATPPPPPARDCIFWSTASFDSCVGDCAGPDEKGWFFTLEYNVTDDGEPFGYGVCQRSRPARR
jgi:hypothetical protein